MGEAAWKLNHNREKQRQTDGKHWIPKTFEPTDLGKLAQPGDLSVTETKKNFIFLLRLGFHHLLTNEPIHISILLISK